MKGLHGRIAVGAVPENPCFDCTHDYCRCIALARRNPLKHAQADAQMCVDAGDIPGALAVWARFAKGDYDI